MGASEFQNVDNTQWRSPIALRVPLYLLNNAKPIPLDFRRLDWISGMDIRKTSRFSDPPARGVPKNLTAYYVRRGIRVAAPDWGNAPCSWNMR